MYFIYEIIRFEKIYKISVQLKGKTEEDTNSTERVKPHIKSHNS